MTTPNSAACNSSWPISHGQWRQQRRPDKKKLNTVNLSRAMSLSTIIVDDEQLARDELAYLLQSVGDVNVVATGKNGVEAVSLIKEHSPDLVFLDVQMPGLDGFGVIKKLVDKKVPLPQIVF